MSHLLGFSYAPRFKTLKRQRLYIFKNRKALDRSSWKIKPAGYADDEIVIQQWDDILRMIATIKLKEATASDLFRRLNSYSKQHALYQALKAFGQVPKSLFILQVIDDPVLRQAIEKQMDRIEHLHRFTRAVSVGNPREFLQAEKEDQENGRSLQAAHQELHYLLELSLPVTEVGGDRGCCQSGGVSRCGGTRLGGFLAAHQPAGRVRFFGRKATG